MNTPTVITKKAAQAKGMEALTEAMRSDDPQLLQVYKDMQTVAKNEWSLVHEGAGWFAVWRVPKFAYRLTPPDFGDGCRPTKLRKKLKTA